MEKQVKHAGMIQRWIAYVIDMILVNILANILALGVAFLVGIGIGIGIMNFSDVSVDAFIATHEVRFTEVIFFTVGMLYFVLTENSSRQASLGKRVIGLVVADETLGKASLAQIFVRKLVFFGIPCIIAAVFLGTIDMSLALYVVWVIVIALPILSTKNKQGLHDLFTKCYIVEKKSLEKLSISGREESNLSS